MMKIILFVVVLLPMNLFATDIRGRLSITPIVGLERVQKFYPTTYMKTRAIYGAIAIYKFPISALEVEYTHAQDTSSDVATKTSYKDSEDKIRVGLRGGFTLSSFLSRYFRGGAQGRKNEHTSTINNTTTTTDTSSKIQPYVGTGINFQILQFVSLTADILATYTPTDDKNLKSYELQPSVGLSLRF